MITRRNYGFIHKNLCSRISKRRSVPKENMIAMINIVFLLLLYFMVAGNLQRNHEIILPFSKQLANSKTKIPILSINRNGKLWLNNREIINDNLKMELLKVSQQNGLKIHADASIDAIKIIGIMNVSSEVGIHKFLLVTQHQVDAG